VNRPRFEEVSASLSGARRALLGSSTREILRSTLEARLVDGTSIGDCRLRRAKLKPRRKLSAYFDISLRGLKGDSCARAVAVTWEASSKRRAGEPAALEEEAIRRGLASPFSSLSASLPELGMRILVSPLDGSFTQLVRMSDPSYVATVVVPGNLEHPLVTTIRYRPRQRHVLRYCGRTGGRNDIFAKLYNNEAGRRSLAAAKWAQERLESCDCAAVCAHAYDDQERALLVHALTGHPLSHSRQTLREEALRHTRHAGNLLAVLHRPVSDLGVELPKRHIRDEIRATKRACEHILAFLPHEGRAIDLLLDRAESVYDRLVQEPRTFVHGDFKLDHLWPQRDRLTVIDFDSAAIADPAMDVGKILADLDWWETIGGPPAARSQHAFLEGYESVSAARVARARVWEVVWLAKAAARRVPVFERLWEKRVVGLVGCARSLLANIEMRLGTGAAIS
jgi:aminoglycoside phosphotransferase